MKPIAKPKYKPRLLKFAAYGDPILSKKCQPVQFPLSEEDQQIIADMVYSIQPAQIKAAKGAWDTPAGMAANQWGIDKSIFLFCPFGDTENVQVMINPSYEPLATLAIIAPSEQTEWEGCFSVPLATGNIKRSTKIRARYQNEQGEIIEKTLTDYDARVFQHETDHVNGFLYDDPRHGKCLEKKVFKNRNEVDAFYDSLREGK